VEVDQTVYEYQMVIKDSNKDDENRKTELDYMMSYEIYLLIVRQVRVINDVKMHLQLLLYMSEYLYRINVEDL
jgi:hypothetical protein